VGGGGCPGADGYMNMAFMYMLPSIYSPTKQADVFTVNSVVYYTFLFQRRV
jgi:hypothetical protein